MKVVFAVALVSGAWYALARAVERRCPQLGGALIALGLAKAKVPTHLARAMRGPRE
jgi:hypothetical protein